MRRSAEPSPDRTAENAVRLRYPRFAQQPMGSSGFANSPLGFKFMPSGGSRNVDPGSNC